MDWINVLLRNFFLNKIMFVKLDSEAGEGTELCRANKLANHLKTQYTNYKLKKNI